MHFYTCTIYALFMHGLCKNLVTSVSANTVTYAETCTVPYGGAKACTIPYGKGMRPVHISWQDVKFE